MECKCGNNRFTPVGTQQKYGTKSNQVQYLVNCDRCHTTVTTSKTSFALHQLLASKESLSREFLRLYDLT